MRAGLRESVIYSAAFLAVACPMGKGKSVPSPAKSHVLRDPDQGGRGLAMG
jgi:hypothetical protein